MSDLMRDLNKEQLKAVMHKDGPLLIVAGAGTGKTTALTQRIAYIIEQNWAKPDEILAMTFTEKAAGEMEERVDRLLPIGYLDLWISTFHGFGERILRQYGLDIGLPADFKLLNEFEQYSLIKKNLDKFALDYYKPQGNPTKFIRALLSLFSRAKDEDISPAEYLKYAEELKQNLDKMLSKSKVQSPKSKVQLFLDSEGNFSEEIAEQEVMRINEVANAYHVYQQLLLENSSLDFGDLIIYTYKLFKERPAILEKFRKQFKYILVDEFQDTNWAQYELIKMLAHPKNNLVVCADDDQSIYRFRGASMSNVLEFTNDFPTCEKVVLVNNYRNKQNILDSSYEFIKLNNPNRLEHQLNESANKKKMKLNKKLHAQTEGEGVIEVIEGNDLDDEVRQVIEKIADLKIKDKSAKWNDFAILVRANDSAKEFITNLEQAGLPYQFVSSRGLYNKPVIMDLIAYLRLLDDYHESPAVFRVLNMSIFEFTYSELINFNYWARKKNWSLYEVLKSLVGLNFGKDTQEKIGKLLSLIEKHSQITREKSVSEVIISFLNDSGYLKSLIGSETKEAQESLDYLNKFYKRVREFESNSDIKTVKAFLQELEIEIDAGEEGALPHDTEIGPEAIKIMTVHAAKGLEFKYVFIVNMVDKRFPTIERTDPILIPDELIKEIMPEGNVHLEEERRLFYVAMTRAKEHLYFSWAPDYGGVRKKKPSRFLEELELVQKSEKIKKRDKKTDSRLSSQSVGSKKQEGCAEIQIPNYFSYTQLAAFSNCPYQYRFAHILKVPIRGKAVFSFGKTMHSTLQRVFELAENKRGMEQGNLFSKGNKQEATGLRISLEEIYEIYEGAWIDDWYESKRQKEEYKKKGKEILKEFYEIHKNDWPNTTMLEKGFTTKIDVDGVLNTIRGTMDRIDDMGGKLKIVDYKTGSPKEKLTFEEKEQLILYQLAAEELFKDEIGSLAFYYLDNNTEVDFLATDEEKQKMIDKIRETIKDIHKCEFPPQPGPLCKFCDYNSICEFRKI